MVLTVAIPVAEPATDHKSIVLVIDYAEHLQLLAVDMAAPVARGESGHYCCNQRCVDSLTHLHVPDQLCRGNERPGLKELLLGTL